MIKTTPKPTELKGEDCETSGTCVFFSPRAALQLLCIAPHLVRVSIPQISLSGLPRFFSEPSSYPLKACNTPRVQLHDCAEIT